MSGAVVRRAQPWLGTLVSVEIVTAEGVDAHAAFSAAFAALARIHRTMSPYEPGSDVARFNEAGAGARIGCDAWTVEVLRHAERLRRASDGWFDVALGSAAGAAYRIKSTDAIEKCAAGARIDLGGIAKGYAVDRAVLALRAQGVKRGLVNAGGDLRVFGHGLWPVAVRGRDDRTTMQVALERGAIATSVYCAGRSLFHHDALIAPPRRAVHAIDCAITVAAPQCVLADALTKVVALTGNVQHPLVTQAGGRVWLH